jgi:hypothetical protein
MIQKEGTQTLSEFISERLAMKDIKEGIKLIDAPHEDTWILKWR